MKKTYFNLHLLTSIILLFFHLPLETIGQNAIVKGSIIDAEEKESLIGANIILNNGIGTATDFEGNYSLSVPAGEYQMTFKYIGYQTQKQNITLAKGEEKIFNISLFASINDYPFSRQHCIRSLGDNKYILYDNGNFSAAYLSGSNASRGVEYKLDTILMTAEKTWEFIHPDSIYGSSTGSIQRLPNGNTLINWGNLTLSGLGAIVSEIDTNNQLVFQLECVPGQNIYRAHKFDWFFDSTIVGCSQNSACNYNSNILIEDSSCYFKLINASISQVNDSLFAAVIDGVPPYVYLWSNNASTSAISPGQSGVYWVLIEDANQCHSDTIYYQFQMTSSFGNIIHSNQTSLFKIFNILGQEVEFKYNTLLVYVYDDGTFRKRYFFKP